MSIWELSFHIKSHHKGVKSGDFCLVLVLETDCCIQAAEQVLFIFLLLLRMLETEPESLPACSAKSWVA